VAQALGELGEFGALPIGMNPLGGRRLFRQ
jgi:hypothetical protein